MNKWDTRFMYLTELVATWSDYQGRKTGAVIVDGDNRIRSTGFNALPDGIVSTEENGRLCGKNRYYWIEHAERNAIYLARESLINCRIYVNWFPCMACARAIVQSGIRELIAYQPNKDDQQWGKDFALSLELFKDAGVNVRTIPRLTPCFNDYTDNTQ